MARKKTVPVNTSRSVMPPKKPLTDVAWLDWDMWPSREVPLKVEGAEERGDFAFGAAHACGNMLYVALIPWRDRNERLPAMVVVDYNLVYYRNKTDRPTKDAPKAKRSA